MTHKQKWEHYRDTRVGTYEFRARTRYAGVAERLFAIGLRDGHSIVDIGAGEQQFSRYLHTQGWRGTYTAVDAVIDGTDLEQYEPPKADFCVCIEVLEHLYNPLRLLRDMRQAARRGVVITTPNAAAVDVIGCDPTHVSVIPADELLAEGLTVCTASWFGKPHDTLLAWAAHR